MLCKNIFEIKNIKKYVLHTVYYNIISDTYIHL